ncbi:ABC transporter ATP-binding protein [Halorubellus sp. JP-L1]|uniref:ABC transporter ATP-binding protein n=1 Tax=Halorubellus sp. JP-L1 TaxID=2715753 RepID=UPI001409A21E|nr:ABC transporter ATP-binding protein [Halorubellus sp. JP-L1]NHN42622.1 ABC transporter ATP-binding protein [Halorubellus sp. JP-L1]
MAAITVSALTKDYGDVRANDDVDLAVEAGEIFGYLGPNGAGKTTTIRTLMGFQSPTSGTATVLGADVHDEDALVEAKRRVGYLPANPAFDEDATGREVLDLHASLKGDSRRDELLDLFDVPVDREVRGYSTGQRQKLGLVQAFMHDPDLLIMDEPTSGLDPLVQRTFNDFVRGERAAGKTVFLSSHVLSEVRRVCDRIGIIRDGRIVEVASVADVLQRSGKFVRARVAADLDREDVALDGVHELSVSPVAGDSTQNGDGITELTFTYTGSFDALVDYFHGYHVLELDVEEAPLEQVFMRFYDDGELDATSVASDDEPETAVARDAGGDAGGDV